MTRRPVFWVAYAALSLVALAIAWQLFPLAIPLVNLDVTLARGEAIAQAETLAAKLGLAPIDARSAARFAHDSETQNYVELEGGGKAEFGALIAGGLYAPYWWEVRVFKPGEIAEVTIRFRPDGATNGFSRRVPETYVRGAATKALDPTAARALAERRATAEWQVDLAPYAMLEQSQQVRQTGRVDHAFVYERPERLGEARVRLRLAVAGDELVEVAPYVHVPESFERRFRELRSANNTIAGIATVSAGLLYGLGGCVLGVLWLARRHWLVVRPALTAGFVVGALMAAMTLSASPAAWFGFDTAQAASIFWLRQAGRALAVLVAGGLGYALVFMAAESLARRAFPQHPQLWRVWSKDGAATPAVVGRTAGGYLFVPLELALVAAFYYATNRWLGWWQPSEVLTDPDILALTIPALMPIAVSLQAGFMEECVFRAVPLALGALIGAHFGRRRVGIAIAFVLQAAIFGAAHANYPGFPAYSRLVELFLPSLAWAAIFLRYGLLPTIVLHAVFDLALFSIPLYLVDAPGAWAQRAAVIAAGLVPLGVVLWRRLRSGAWAELAPALRNAAWAPPARVPAAETTKHVAVATRTEALVQRSLPVLGIAGLVAWFAFTPMQSDVPAMRLDRERAEAAADAALQARGVNLGPEWRRLSAIRVASEEDEWSQHKFVWSEAGPDTYRALIGAPLAPPLWVVRYAMFDGDVAARAEEWRVMIDVAGNLRQLRHLLPEAKPGARLAKEAALALAEHGLAERLGVDPAAVRLIAAEERDRPARTDWVFTFVDPRVDVGKDGEARAAVAVAGDEVVGAVRYVHVPEAWLRREREREGRIQIGRVGGTLLAGLAALAALVLAVKSWMRGNCDMRALAFVLIVALLAAAGGVALAWPSLALRLKTTEPVAWQTLLIVSGSLLSAAAGALTVALASGVGAWAARTARPTGLAGVLPTWAAGAAAAFVVAGVGALAGRLVPPDAPLWPSLARQSAAIPWLAAAVEGLGVVSSIGIGLFVLHVLDRVTGAWTRRSWLAVAVIVALITTLVAARAGEAGGAVVGGAIAGFAAAAMLFSVLRFDPRTVPGYVVVSALVVAAENAALEGTRAGWTGFVILTVVSVIAGIAATRYVGRQWDRAAIPPPAA